MGAKATYSFMQEIYWLYAANSSIYTDTSGRDFPTWRDKNRGRGRCRGGGGGKDHGYVIRLG